MAGVSLRVVIALLITFATVIATIIAFVPTYLSGVDAVRSTLADLRGAYVGRTAEGITAFFDLPIANLKQVQSAIKHNLVNLTDEESWTHWASDFTVAFPDTINVVTYRLWGGDTGLPGNRTLHTSVDNRFVDYFGQTVYVTYNATHLLAYPYLRPTYTIIPITALAQRAPPDYMTYAEITARQNPSASVIWTPLYMGADSPQVAAVAVIPDQASASPAVRGCIAAELTPESLSPFFESLGLRAGARAVVVDAASGFMLGNSWGESTVIHGPQIANVFAPEHLRLQMKTLLNHSDETTLRIVNEIGVDQILTGTAPWATDLYSGRKLTYVNVIEVTGPGLRLRLLLIMPEIDFMEKVYNTQTTTIIIVVVVALVLIGLGIALAHVLITPLIDLQEKMELTARLEEVDDNQSLSLFAEVAEMQSSYRRMAKELHRMKSYLPQSVLYNLAGDDEEDEDEEATVSIPNDSLIMSQSHFSHSQEKEDMAMSRSGISAGATVTSNSGRTRDSRSKRSALKSPKGVAAAGLNTRGAVASKRISVAVFNVKAFHKAGKGGSSHAMTQLQAAYLSSIETVVREHKGVVDVFQGDHVSCSFNAVGNCPAANRRAAQVALRVIEHFSGSHSDHPVNVGIAAGTAFVGNMGTEGMRRFCIVGPVLPQAMAMERLGKRYNVNALMTQSTLQDIEHDCHYAIVDRVHLPGSKTPQVVGALLGMKAKSAESEWMYDLQEAMKDDPFNLLNSAWAMVQGGNGTNNSKNDVMTQLAALDYELEVQLAAAAPDGSVTVEEVGSPLDAAANRSPTHAPKNVYVKAKKDLPEHHCRIIEVSSARLSALVASTAAISREQQDLPSQSYLDRDKIVSDLGYYFQECL